MLPTNASQLIRMVRPKNVEFVVKMDNEVLETQHMILLQAICDGILKAPPICSVILPSHHNSFRTTLKDHLEVRSVNKGNDDTRRINDTTRVRVRHHRHHNIPDLNKAGELSKRRYSCDFVSYDETMNIFCAFISVHTF